MPERPGFRFWKVLCWLVIGLLIAGWVRGCSSFDSLQYRTGKLIEPRPEPGREAWWMFSLRTYGLAVTRGSLSISLSDYDSMGPEPDALSRQWADHLGFAVQSGPAPSGPAFRWLDWSWPDRVIVLGMGFETSARSGNRIRAARAPLAVIIAAAAAPLLISWRRERRLKQRLATGRCLHCGYNRAGLPGDQPCPECAMKPTTQQRSNAATE